MTVISDEELSIYDEISRLAESLWDESQKVEGLNSDPKMFSVMLFKRLWSNHRGYILLYNNKLFLEADIILRSVLEAAICIAANYQLRDEFVNMMRSDAAFTLLGQIKLYRDFDLKDLVKEGEAFRRSLLQSLPKNRKPAKLQLKTLAQLGKVPELYSAYQELSGTSAHVTGVSLIKGVVGVDGSGTQDWGELHQVTKSSHLMTMAFATLKGSIFHSIMIDHKESIETANNLLDKMNSV